jgi:hypothetical protein
MDANEFQLTLRKEDILDIYGNQIHFNLFSEGCRYRMFLFALFLSAAALCLFFVPSGTNNFFLVAVMFAISGYQGNEILKQYLPVKKAKDDVVSWINAIKKYKTHRLVLGDSLITYHRDTELFAYRVDQAKKVYHTDSYFYLALNDGMDLLVPAKSLGSERYKEFTAKIDAMLATKHANPS